VDAARALEREKERVTELEGLASGLRLSLNESAAVGGSAARDLAAARAEAAALRSQVEAVHTQLSRAMSAVQDAVADRDEAAGSIAELEARVHEVSTSWAEAAAEWGVRESQLRAAEALAESRAAGLAGAVDDSDRLRADLSSRDDELAALSQSIANLQLVVDGLAAGKVAAEEREVEACRELGEVRLRLAAAVAAAAAAPAPAPVPPSPSDGDSPPLRLAHGQAQVRITQLQQSVHELRAALADSAAMQDVRRAAASKDEGVVDRRLAAAIVVACLSLQRGAGRGTARARDSLTVVSRVLGFTPSEVAAVGLNDGGEGGLLGGLFGLLSPSPSKGGGGGGGEEAVSLGSAFAQFLLEETAETRGEAPEGALDAPDAPRGPAPRPE
jgi:hypothetical protein